MGSEMCIRDRTLPGESTRDHPAPFPLELAYRLVRMFSFVGDTILEPFMGLGTAVVAAARCGRNSIGVEVEPAYLEKARIRLEMELCTLFDDHSSRIIVRQSAVRTR